MSNTYWLQTRVERSYEGDSDDLSLMYSLSRKLDKICRERWVTPVSKFNDLTDLEYNFMGEDEDDEPDLDPDTGLAYGLDKMEWFDARLGVETFE